MKLLLIVALLLGSTLSGLVEAKKKKVRRNMKSSMSKKSSMSNKSSKMKKKAKVKRTKKKKPKDPTNQSSSLLPGTPADSICIQQCKCQKSNRRRRRFSQLTPYFVAAADFEKGTLIIDTPGSYRLCEDISFYPNPPSEGLSPAEAMVPTDFASYDENNFGLGFFAAIAIAADNVDLYLNGHTLQQSEEHALMQRFYANIELNNSPFIPGAGPAQFVGENGNFHASSNLRILGPGTLGRSSHHGIHGNNNANVEISNVTFENFEVAAISINNVDGLRIADNQVKGNRKDVPVTGMFSAAHFIR